MHKNTLRVKFTHSIVAISIAVVTAMTPIKNTQAGAVIGATEITQILNNVELIGIFGQEALHLAETIKQYQIMLQNLQKLPSIIETNATNALLSLANSTQVGMALKEARANKHSPRTGSEKEF